MQTESKEQTPYKKRIEDAVYMLGNTRKIIEIIALKEGVTPEYVEEEMKKALCAAMASKEPRASAFWEQLAPNGEMPDVGRFIESVAQMVEQTEGENAVAQDGFFVGDK